MSADPFGTASLRDRVLAAWAASPARFREDANAEEDLALGGYRDRVVVELAQNAADAARRAGVDGRLLLTLADGVLVASNTGAPLQADGVESLSTLRASAKRHDQQQETVGRFGVGFAAVLAVSDEPRVASTTGAVRWSRADARAAVLGVPSLAEELARRGGHVPVLRLPWSDDGDPEPGFDTSVVLPLRDDAAVVLCRRLLGEVDDTLLLALPGLAEIVVEIDGKRAVFAGDGRWQVVRRGGRTDPGLLADRPTEERAPATWSVLWARPLAGQPVPATVHAPTPTDEPVDLPALLIATFPLDPSRRHVAPGPLTDFLVGEAAAAFAELAAGAEEPLAMVPGPVPAGALDAALRRSVLDAMAVAPLLGTVDGNRIAPRDAVSVIGLTPQHPLFAVLDQVLPGLVGDRRELERVGGTRLALADVVDQLADLRRDPSWWRGLYAALTDLVTGQRDAFGALPVPLTDGRLVRGLRGVLLPGEPLPAGLDALGLRVVHPDAAHDVLLRLGAVEATARSVLTDPAVQSAVADAEGAPDAGELAAAVLGLVAAAGLGGAELPWLAALLLPDDEGGLVPAGDLVLPGSLLAEVCEPGALGRPAADLLETWGPDVLAAAGVGAAFTVLVEPDVALEDDLDHDLADEQDWTAALLRDLPPQDLPPLLTELRAVRDLDLVRSDAWPRVLAVFAADPELRAAVVQPARTVLSDGRRVDLTTYTAWWLRRHAQLDGRAPAACHVASAMGADELEGLYDVVRSDLDDDFLRAIGVRTSLAALLAEPGGPDDLLDRLADAGRAMRPDQLAAVYAALATVEPSSVSPPERVRVGATTVVAAGDVVVLVAPHHLQLKWPTEPLVVPLSAAAALAEVLDVPTSSELLADVQLPAGDARDVPAGVLALLPAGAEQWQEHDALVVGGQEVDWWVGVAGDVHACTVDGLARGLAWAARRWDQRLVVAAVLAEPDRLGELIAEMGLEG